LSETIGMKKEPFGLLISQPSSSRFLFNQKLPSNYFFNIFSGEAGSHIPPKEAPPLSYGRLLKGFIGINEDFEYK